MNREKFKKLLDSETGKLSKEEIHDVMNRSIDILSKNTKRRGDTNVIIAVQEFSEMIKEATDYLRGKPDDIGLLEELADTILSAEYIKLIIGIDDELLDRAIKIKIDRLREKIDSGKLC